MAEFTEDDITACWTYYRAYLVDILNGDYDLEQARDDLRGLIGSEFDSRCENPQTKQHETGNG